MNSFLVFIAKNLIFFRKGIDFLKFMYTFPLVEPNRETKSGLPPWHRKAQKAYRVNRVIIVLQMVAALVMCGVILVGVEKVLH